MDDDDCLLSGGALDEYKEQPTIKMLAEQSRDCDYIIAPIADNRMFQIINSFINGEITDEQCKHCLAATNLGMQYIFISEKAVSQAKLIERCYISDNERVCILMKSWCKEVADE